MHPPTPLRSSKAAPIGMGARAFPLDEVEATVGGGGGTKLGTSEAIGVEGVEDSLGTSDWTPRRQVVYLQAEYSRRWLRTAPQIEYPQLIDLGWELGGNGRVDPFIPCSPLNRHRQVLREQVQVSLKHVASTVP